MKKILLNKETVRKLDDKELKHANGGAVVTCKTTVTFIDTFFCTRTCPVDTKDDCHPPTRGGC